MTERAHADAVGPGAARLVSPVPPSRLDDVMALFAQAWWTRTRERAKVAAILASAQPTIGVLSPEGALVAFVRALTDFESKAVIVDLIVDEPLRGTGLGRRLVQAVLDDPALARVNDFELYCDEDLVPYYASQGFRQPARTRFMRRSPTD